VTLQTLPGRPRSVLALACFALTLGCASNKPKPTLEQQSQEDLARYQEQVRKVIKDPERAEKVAALAADFQEVMLERALAQKDYEAKIAALDANYTATRADYEALVTQRERDSKAFVQEIIAARTQLISLTTPEEWNDLKDARLSAFEEFAQRRP
jgi:hypothetical protein